MARFRVWYKMKPKSGVGPGGTSVSVIDNPKINNELDIKNDLQKKHSTSNIEITKYESLD
jgi:hypothetical protein